ncbi:hypothetical protein [Mucilaginibacter terrae]|uniref:Cytidylate kinase n=1 Tax=Mucilaginibacter terrae TaxID=1955052 RepID=A0ABU3GVP2_9SPHI|nr:hypothetical protein [Mucilaginibacter terrae]MDT3403848.1 cytidylate kinase [Mucilaginibacter terrae]
MELAQFLVLKQQYKPNKTEVLFIADGMPVNERYFYLKNSNIYRAVKTAYSQVFGEFKTDDEFLEFFKEMGCYFDSLTNEPIKHMPPAEQRKARQQGVESLAHRIAEMQPRLIIISLKVIEKFAREAINLSGVDMVEHIAVTPFPVKSMVNVNNCINGVVAALRTVEWDV